jgi:hypothetical protein
MTSTAATAATAATAGAWTDLAHRIAGDGIGRHELAVRALLLASGAPGRAPQLARILGDRCAPAVVRERAVGQLATVLANGNGASRQARAGTRAASVTPVAQGAAAGPIESPRTSIAGAPHEAASAA